MFEILSPEDGSRAEIAGIMHPYEDIGLPLADAALAHLAGRENIPTV
jgi:hypothetical protein